MKLNRKAMVLAVGAALAAPTAYAQVTSKAGSDWGFYGKFWPEFARVNGEKATANDNATREGISTLLITSNGLAGGGPGTSDIGGSKHTDPGEKLVGNV